MKTEEALTRARALIEDERAWCIGALENPWGQRCALGAIGAAVNGHATKQRGRKFYKTVDALASVLPPLGEGWTRVTIFNDKLRLEQHACVIAAFDAAIEREQQKAAK